VPWNKRESFGEREKVVVTPVYKRYEEKAPKDVDCLIITKSVISGTCVVRTNPVSSLPEES
jgi:hypothetical protein